MREWAFCSFPSSSSKQLFITYYASSSYSLLAFFELNENQKVVVTTTTANTYIHIFIKNKYVFGQKANNESFYICCWLLLFMCIYSPAIKQLPGRRHLLREIATTTLVPLPPHRKQTNTPSANCFNILAAFFKLLL